MSNTPPPRLKYTQISRTKTERTKTGFEKNCRNGDHSPKSWATSLHQCNFSLKYKWSYFRFPWQSAFLWKITCPLLWDASSSEHPIPSAWGWSQSVHSHQKCKEDHFAMKILSLKNRPFLLRSISWNNRRIEIIVWLKWQHHFSTWFFFGAISIPQIYSVQESDIMECKWFLEATSHDLGRKFSESWSLWSRNGNLKTPFPVRGLKLRRIIEKQFSHCGVITLNSHQKYAVNLRYFNGISWLCIPHKIWSSRADTPTKIIEIPVSEQKEFTQ